MLVDLQGDDTPIPESIAPVASHPATSNTVVSSGHGPLRGLAVVAVVLFFVGLYLRKRAAPGGKGYKAVATA